MKKVLCIGDSLALPGHKNKYEDTWIYKLKKAYPKFDFITFFKRGLTTEILVNMGGGDEGIDLWPKGGDCLEAYLPNIIILQLGIVDCAPRLLRKFERIIIERLPKKFTDFYINLIKKYRKRSANNTYVSLDKFKDNLRYYLNRAINNKVEKVIIIGISFPSQKMIERNKSIIKNVLAYNRTLEKLGFDYNIAEIIFPLDSSKYNYEIFEDGYHPNKKGHELVYNKIVEMLD